jgi:hypothetical protein
MGRLVANADHRDAVDFYRSAAFGCFPGIWAATSGMDSWIANAKDRLTVDENIGGAGNGRAGHGV